MKMATSFLSQDEREMVHQLSVRILEEVGVKVKSEKIKALLEKRGANVDYDTNIVKIDRTLIDWAIKACPKKFLMGARNPVFEFEIPSYETVYTTDGCGPYAIDFETGKRRPAVTQDIINNLKVFEEMDMGKIAWSPVLASDMPVHSTEVRAYLMSFIHTSKHVQTGLDKAEEVPYLKAALREILGSDDEIRKRKICSMIYCPVAPLVHESQMMEGYLELGDLDIPILILPMPAPGSTGPASLYSNVALSNAEALSCIVIYQIANPGRALIYGSAIASLDFSTGAFIEGAPEMVLQSGACLDMANYYCLPDTLSGCLTDAKECGAQATAEKMTTTLPLVLGGASAINGIGLLEASMTMSLEQLVVDNELAHICKRIKDGINICPDLDYFEDILYVGPGGHFLKQKTTRNAARSQEFYKPLLIDRNAFNAWENLGRPNLYTSARKQVTKILSEGPKNPLKPSIEKTILEIMEASDRELK